jgi:UDP-glucuronate decarboxylase
MNNPVLDQDLEHTLHALSAAEREAFEGASILLTGCAGFLGYYCLQFLACYGAMLGVRSVIGVDSLILRRPAWLERLSSQAPFIRFHELDIARGNLEALVGAEAVTHVIHMASIGSSPFFRAHPIETVDATVWGLRHLLDFYRSRALKGLLFFSSSEIYGDPVAQFIPTAESYRGNVPCVGPRACYDESKRFGETLCYLFAKQHDMPVAVVRPFNTYGPGMVIDDQRAPADFAKAVIEQRDLEILSDGSPTRTFCYVADAMAGYFKVLFHGRFDVFNIGMDQPEITMRALAEIYRRQGETVFGYRGSVRLGVSADPFYLSDVPNRRCPDIGHARRTLGYQPTIDVEDGVGRYLSYLKHEGIA